MLKKIICISSLLVITIFIMFFIAALLDDSELGDYIRPLRNDYYIIHSKETGTELKNSRAGYKYSDNYPDGELLRIVETGDTLLLEYQKKDYEEKQYYKIDTSKDEIIGPLNEKEFINEVIEDIEINSLIWHIG